MKTIVFSLKILLVVLLFSCNNNSSSNTRLRTSGNDSMKNMKMDSMRMDTMKNMNSMKDMKHESMGSMMEMDEPSFKNVDANVSKFLTVVTLDYLDVKNSLTNDNAVNAQHAAEKLTGTITHFDKSFFPTQQKKEYDKYGSVIKEQAQAIADINNIEMERAAFSELSNQLNGLIKAFGSGQMLYRDNCPMAFNSKGAIWLSETEEIHNPYLGIKMTSCGKIEGMIE